MCSDWMLLSIGMYQSYTDVTYTLPFGVLFFVCIPSMLMLPVTVGRTVFQAAVFLDVRLFKRKM